MECSKSFSQKDLKKRKGFMRKKGHMLRHIKEVHMSPEQYECPPCRLVFKNREFNSHVKEKHPDWLGVNLVKRFKINDEEYDCTVCGVVYKTREGPCTHDSHKFWHLDPLPHVTIHYSARPISYYNSGNLISPSDILGACFNHSGRHM